MLFEKEKPKTSSADIWVLKLVNWWSEVLKTKGAKMIVRGEFDVKLNPLEAYATGLEGTKLGRMSIDKTFRGELSATSKGEMLSAMTSVKGSAGYVAIEQVTGTLNGKKRLLYFSALWNYGSWH